MEELVLELEGPLQVTESTLLLEIWLGPDFA